MGLHEGQSHYYTKNGRRSYCFFCRRQFDSEADLNLHRRKTHVDDFFCLICDKEFDTARAADQVIQPFSLSMLWTHLMGIDSTRILLFTSWLQSSARNIQSARGYSKPQAVLPAILRAGLARLSLVNLLPRPSVFGTPTISSPDQLPQLTA